MSDLRYDVSFIIGTWTVVACATNWSVYPAFIAGFACGATVMAAMCWLWR